MKKSKATRIRVPVPGLDLRPVEAEDQVEDQVELILTNRAGDFVSFVASRSKVRSQVIRILHRLDRH